MKFITALFAFILFISSPAQAESPSVAIEPEITIENAYAFATAPGGTTGAAFMTLKNSGASPDSLIKAESNVAKINEIHENIIDPDDGKMMMRKIKSITIPANGQALLHPKGMHIMLIKLKEPLTLGEEFPLTLTFEKTGEIKQDIKIVQPGLIPDNAIKKEETPLEKKLPQDIVPPSIIQDDFPTDSFEKKSEDVTEKTTEQIDEQIQHF